MKTLIKNGKIVDPTQRLNAKADLLVDKGKIVKIEKSIREKEAKVIDAEGKIVSPGFVDMHTHVREPGREDKETIYTALRAAVKGGFTTVCAMPNTDPPCDSQGCVRFLLEKTLKAGVANLLPVGTITKGREGKAISEMNDLKQAGCLALSDDGDSVKDPVLMRKALEYASMIDLLVISHCEDRSLSGDGVMHEGYYSTILGLAPIPPEAESVIVDRDIQLAELTGARLHIAHVSSKKSVEIIKQAKRKGIKVTAEVTPHHFTLKDEDLIKYDTNMKVNPPLRSVEDAEALKKALKDGIIDVIATDHAPHLENEKEKEFDYAPFGMIGLETALSLSVMGLIDKGYLDWPGLIEKLSVNPCKILKYDRGTLKEGAVADITIIDPDKEWVYGKEEIESLSHNSPFIGWKMKAKAVYVICNGRIVVQEGVIV